MTTPTPQEMLRALRRGPYAGHGGVVALAQALHTPLPTTESWLAGRRQPTWEARQRITALWKSTGQPDQHGLHHQEAQP